MNIGIGIKQCISREQHFLRVFFKCFPLNKIGYFKQRQHPIVDMKYASLP